MNCASYVVAQAQAGHTPVALILILWLFTLGTNRHNIAGQGSEPRQCVSMILVDYLRAGIHNYISGTLFQVNSRQLSCITPSGRGGFISALMADSYSTTLCRSFKSKIPLHSRI